MIAFDPLVEDWQELAACAGLELELFYPADKGPRAYGAAREICSACPVIESCAATGDRVERDLTPAYVHGLLAGETPTERVARRKASKVPSGHLLTGAPRVEASTSAVRSGVRLVRHKVEDAAPVGEPLASSPGGSPVTS